MRQRCHSPGSHQIAVVLPGSNHSGIRYFSLPEAGEGGIYRVDLSKLFQCTVEGDLNFDVDTEALVAAGYTGVELDFGSDADEDYSNLTLSMDGATYKGTEGNVAGFTLPTIPEPSTATLSLLALAALASRRRRG